MNKGQQLFPVVLIAILLVSCQNSAQRSATYFDDLVETQIKQLSLSKAAVTKKVTMDRKEDLITFVPNASQWQGELNAFRQLSAVERPAARKGYRVTEGVRDKKSNLDIRWYTAIDKSPITDLKIYYYRQFENIKRIEATWNEQNVLFATTRKMTLEFDDVQGKPLLSSYATEGVQKMILTDSVRFSILSTISN